LGGTYASRNRKSSETYKSGQRSARQRVQPFNAKKCGGGGGVMGPTTRKKLIRITLLNSTFLKPGTT